MLEFAALLRVVEQREPLGGSTFPGNGRGLGGDELEPAGLPGSGGPPRAAIRHA